MIKNFKDCRPTLPGPSKQAFLKFIYLFIACFSCKDEMCTWSDFHIVNRNTIQ